MKSKRTLLKIRTIFLRIVHDPALFLVCFITPIALVMLVIVPPFQAPDEHTHFFKVVQLSEGKLIGHNMGTSPDYAFPLVGDYLPSYYKITTDHYVTIRIHNTEKLNLSQVKADLMHPNQNSNIIPTPFENTVVYPPLAYLPQATAVGVTNIFVKSALVKLYVARLAVLATAIVLLYFTIKRMPFGKWAVVALTATPMSLLLLVSCSGDAITTGIIALFIANVLAVVVKRQKVTRSETVTMIALAAALGLCKSPYELVVLFALVIPMQRFASRKSYYKTIAALFGIPFILAAVWAIAVNKLYLNVATGSDTAVQAHFVMRHPLSFIHTLVRTYFGDAGDYVPRDYIDLSAGLAAPLPLWFVFTDFIFISLLILQENVRSFATVLTKRLRLVSALLVAVLFVSINALLYITFTAVGATLINGLQGRYFIPVTLLLIPALVGMLQTDKRRYEKLLVCFYCFVGLTAVVSYVAIFKRYY